MDQAVGLRNTLVENLKQQKNITDARVEQTFRAVPRHLFIPDVPLEKAYADEAIVTKTIDEIPVSSISQPAIVAIMLEQLALEKGERVLEIGAGTGYNAALMAHLVGANGHVTTIDLDDDIVERARENLTRAKVTNVQVICADGGFGYAPNAPYDAIIATVGIWDIPIAWFEQLREGGRLVAPIRFGAIQKAVAFRRAENTLISESLAACGFMNLRGEFAAPRELARVNEMVLRVDDASNANIAALEKLLSEMPRQVEIGATGEELRKVLDYAALRGETVIGIFSEKDKLGFSVGWGLLSGYSSLAMLTYPDFTAPPSDEISVYGDDSALSQLGQVLEEWDKRGRPKLDDAKITAAPLGTFAHNSDKIILRKRWMEYQIEF